MLLAGLSRVSSGLSLYIALELTTAGLDVQSTTYSDCGRNPSKRELVHEGRDLDGLGGATFVALGGIQGNEVDVAVKTLE